MKYKPSKKILEIIPGLFKTEDIPPEERLVYIHFLIEGWDWYIVEYDPEDRIFFGFVDGESVPFPEWGYIEYENLKALRSGPVEVEIEKNWKIRPMKEVLPSHKYNR